MTGVNSERRAGVAGGDEGGTGRGGGFPIMDSEEKNIEAVGWGTWGEGGKVM